MPVMTLAEFGFTGDGEAAFLEVLPQMEREVRSVDGCREYRLWRGPAGEYVFFVVWDDQAAVDRWVQNEFHRTTLMPAFRRWSDLGWFSTWTLTNDHNRVRKCPSCGRWAQEQPGWDSALPKECGRCGAAIPPRSTAAG